MKTNINNVIAGILFGPISGFVVGAFGTSINAFSPAGSLFEFAAIVPHALMGLISGIVAMKYPKFLSSFTIIIGHLLNVVMFLIFGLITMQTISMVEFWLGLGFESFLGILSIIIIYSIYSLAFITKEESN